MNEITPLQLESKIVEQITPPPPPGAPQFNIWMAFAFYDGPGPAKGKWKCIGPFQSIETARQKLAALGRWYTHKAIAALSNSSPPPREGYPQDCTPLPDAYPLHFLCKTPSQNNRAAIFQFADGALTIFTQDDKNFVLHKLAIPASFAQHVAIWILRHCCLLHDTGKIPNNPQIQ